MQRSELGSSTLFPRTVLTSVLVARALGDDAMSKVFLLGGSRGSGVVVTEAGWVAVKF